MLARRASSAVKSDVRILRAWGAVRADRLERMRKDESSGRKESNVKGRFGRCRGGGQVARAHGRVMRLQGTAICSLLPRQDAKTTNTILYRYPT